MTVFHGRRRFAWPNSPDVCVQDKSRVEIIVVDAGCKDNTMEAVASMKLEVKLRCAFSALCQVGRQMQHENSTIVYNRVRPHARDRIFLCTITFVYLMILLGFRSGSNGKGSLASHLGSFFLSSDM